MAPKRKRRYRKATSRQVLLQEGPAGELKPARVVHPTKERRQHGVVVRHERIGENGERLIASVIDQPTALDRLADLGCLGDGDGRRRLMDAGDWFRQRAELLQLRSSVTAGYERQARGDRRMTSRQVRASLEMKRLADRIGAAHFNRLFDLLVWDIMPLVEPRRRETVAALSAAAKHLNL